MSNLSITTREIEYDSDKSLITKVIIQIGEQSYNVTLNDPINESNKYTITKIETTNNPVKEEKTVKDTVKETFEVYSNPELINNLNKYGFKSDKVTNENKDKVTVQTKTPKKKKSRDTVGR